MKFYDFDGMNNMSCVWYVDLFALTKLNVVSLTATVCLTLTGINYATDRVIFFRINNYVVTTSSQFSHIVNKRS